MIQLYIYMYLFSEKNMISLLCGIWEKKTQMNLFTKQTHRLSEWTYGYRGDGREGIVREFGIDMYTLLDLKWITNKDLLHSMGELCFMLCSYHFFWWHILQVLTECTTYLMGKSGWPQARCRARSSFPENSLSLICVVPSINLSVNMKWLEISEVNKEGKPHSFFVLCNKSKTAKM